MTCCERLAAPVVTPVISSAITSVIASSLIPTITPVITPRSIPAGSMYINTTSLALLPWKLTGHLQPKRTDDYIMVG